MKKTEKKGSPFECGFDPNATQNDYHLITIFPNGGNLYILRLISRLTATITIYHINIKHKIMSANKTFVSTNPNQQPIPRMKPKIT
jgi:hypothetical protein